MTGFATQIALVLGVLATAFAGPALAITLLRIRKRRREARRRSPIGIDLLRSPGHSLREQLEERQLDLLTEVQLLAFVPVTMLALVLAQAHVLGSGAVERWVPIYVIFGVLGLSGAIYRLWNAAEHMDNLRAGFDAELAVGQELDQLMRQGAAVFHDFPAEGFNIDHIVIAPQGAFAVETKGYTKRNDVKGRAAATVVYDGKALRFPTWTTSEPLEQAERQADWLAKWCARSIGEPSVRVTPVLALPGWYVEEASSGTVEVISGRQLPALLRSRGAEVLSRQDVERLAFQVEQRCRTVVPTYRRSMENK